MQANAALTGGGRFRVPPAVRGPAATIAAVLVLIAASRLGVTVPNPGVPLLLVVVYAAIAGGFVPGMVSAAITILYAALFFSDSAAGRPFAFTGDEPLRLLVLGIAAPLAVLFGALVKRRLDGAKRGEVGREQAFSRGLIAAMQDGLLVSAADDRRIVEVNPRLLEMTGFSGEELVGQLPPFPFWPESDHDLLEGSLARALAGEPGEYDAVYRRKDGSTFPVIVSRAPLRDQKGAVTGSVSTVKDVTERKRAEAALRDSEERYRAVTDAASDAIISIDETSRIVFVNAGAEKTFGYTRDELLGQELTMLMPEDQRAPHEAGFERYLKTGRRNISWQGIELPGLHKDGRTIPLEVSFGEAVIGGDRIFTGYVRDITERKHAEDALRHSREQLQHAQRLEAVGRLAGGVAHDFNNLLTAISGYTELLLDDIGRAHPMRGDLEEIKRTADRATALTAQLLAFSRRQAMEPKVLDLNRVVAEIEPMLRRLIGEDIHLLTLLEPGLSGVRADRGQLEQVIMNLAVNSRDAMPDGGLLTIETANVYLDGPYAREHVGVEPGQYVMLAVSDNGIGMDAETQEHLFEPFFTTKDPGKGTGLGLATVYGIVTQSGGNVWVYSELTKGTTIRAYLPAVAAPGDLVAPPEEPRVPVGGTETILLVEDDPAVRALSHTVLRRHGYNVLDAAAPSQALLIAERHAGPIHLMLTDVVMPELTGPQLAERLGSQRPEMKVLFMSGYTADAIVNHGVLDGAAEFIQKPYRPEALVRKVRGVLDARRGLEGITGDAPGSKENRDRVS